MADRRPSPPGPPRGRPHAIGWLALPVFAALAVACAVEPPSPTVRQLWLYYGTNLAKDDAVPRLEKIWRRAAAAGYTHVLLTDPKFARLGQMDEEYFRNLNRARTLAAELGLELVPGMLSIGRSTGTLALDPNLAEGLPVENAPFVVRNAIAVPVTAPPTRIPDRPRRVDFGVRLAGNRAGIRNNIWRARWFYDVEVHPRRSYRVSVWIRTRDYGGRPLVRVLDRDQRSLLLLENLRVERTQDWTRHDVVFSSLDRDRIQLHFGAWKRATGTVEFRDWSIAESGPVNLLRRPGTPFVARTGDGTPLVEGRDFEALRDPRMGNSPWAGHYDHWHEPPALRTRLPEGTRLEASWHHAAVVYKGQVTLCLSDSAAFARLEDEARRVRGAFHARAYMMQIDEVRAMNQDAPCRARGVDAGAMLADATRRLTGFLAGSRVYVWNDMYDPFHNAVNGYALVRGSLAGAWEGLAPEVTIVNWNAGRPRESLRFFASRGHKQVIAGYYDGRPADVARWLRAARGVPGIEGVMYTTWEDNFDDLEAFARACGVPPRPVRGK